MSDTEIGVPALDGDEAEDVGDVIRPVTAGTEALEDDGATEEYADASRPQTAGESNYSEGDEGNADGGAAPDPVDRPPSARPGSARPSSARPPSARPDSSRPPSVATDARPPSATTDAARPSSARPPSARPASATAAEPADEQPADEQPADEQPADEKPADDTDAAAKADEESADIPPPAGGDGAAEGAGEGTAEERPGSSHSHHPDVITDINQSPEAHAELDEMAQQQAQEVIRSRQNSAGSERNAGGAGDRRRTSASNASARSAPPSRQGPVESLANMAMQPPSPSKIKTGPWLTGTYRLPKSGKIISGEELCDALERMTNAYIDKYTREKGNGLAKEIAPGAATVFNTKKLSQDEYDSMIARLYKPKDRNVSDGDRIQLITLKFGDDGQEQWVPVKTVSVDEQQAYMCELYQRCLDNRKKTKDELAAKYLKPLGPPRKK
ncbi:hypothetical protein VaNZ11_007401 [Volvox africanus]|uniref:Chromo domain-containing protein n=1 Tax=Volvox africanus TaxID=51714 RepID=A0ABQ5S3N5_9CHLO|nr:hypothetical protein VaNZ11_007401 [Volvox africanus]